MEQKPRLMMHFILGLQRLIESGCTDHVRKESFMLIVDFVLSESPYLQFTAAQVLEHLTSPLVDTLNFLDFLIFPRNSKV